MTRTNPPTDPNLVKQLLKRSLNLFKLTHTHEPTVNQSFGLVNFDLANQSPSSLAVFKNDMERQFYLDLEAKKGHLSQLVLNLKNLERLHRQGQSVGGDGECDVSVVEDFDIKQAEIKASIASCEEDIQEFLQDTTEAAHKLDELIIFKREKELEVMTQASQRYRRIVVSLRNDQGEPTILRKFEPIQSFSDLQLRVEAWNPEFRCVLLIPNSCEIVGSQAELLFAYQDGQADSDVLNLELKLYPKSQKRGIDSVDDVEVQGITHIGKWLPSEMELFKVGVQQCGWGNWKDVAQVVETRTIEQVRSFSKTQAGRFAKTEENVMPTLSKLADGLWEVSKNVTRVLEGVDQVEVTGLEGAQQTPNEFNSIA